MTDALLIELQIGKILAEGHSARCDLIDRVYGYYPGHIRDIKVARIYYNLALVSLDAALLEMKNTNLNRLVLQETDKSTYRNSFLEYFYREPKAAQDQHSFANALAHQQQFFDWVAGDLGLVGEVTTALPLIREFVKPKIQEAEKKIKRMYKASEDSEELVNGAYRKALDQIWDFASTYDIKMPALNWERFA